MKSPGRPRSRWGDYRTITVEVRADLLDFLNSEGLSYRKGIEGALLLLCAEQKGQEVSFEEFARAIELCFQQGIGLLATEHFYVSPSQEREESFYHFYQMQGGAMSISGIDGDNPSVWSDSVSLIQQLRASEPEKVRYLLIDDDK